MAPAEVRQLLPLIRQLSAAVQAALVDHGAPGHWVDLERRFRQQTGRSGAHVFADAVAQAVACGCVALAASRDQPLPDSARRWLIDQADPLLAAILDLCLAGDEAACGAHAIGRAAALIRQHLQTQRPEKCSEAATCGAESDRDVTGFFERLLSQSDARSRRRQGVYYTPPDLAAHVVRSVDQVLRMEFMLADGLADRTTWQQVRVAGGGPDAHVPVRPDAPFLRILDPAMGAGVFLLAVFDHIRHWWAACRSREAAPADRPRESWDDFVVDTLLPRICGQELALPAVVVAHLLLATRLHASGFHFTRPGRINFLLGNTLRAPRIGDCWLTEDDRPYTVVLGNPPFAGVSENRYRWISQLLRGQAPGHHRVANYLEADGRPLGEKKHWLEDDYVKFLRLAHWLIERTEAGVIGFVTNHGFLDNVTFRGLRQQLLRTFPCVTVVDLHGNTRTGERPPEGVRDESVFGIEQGVAISLWRRPLHGPIAPRIDHADLWGQRESKLAALAGTEPVRTTRLDPHAPHYFLVPRDGRRESEYARGCPLPEVMPVYSTAAVTARDGFVVAFSETELRDRLAVLCDERVADDAIRAQFFASSRSTKYPTGDTRGWQLAAARARLRREPDLARYICDCLYRPFDRRRIFWTPWMIDWPREAVMRHLAAGDNFALVARRQLPASHRCDYFWVTDTIALDGLIRSDNRGSESVFPLFLQDCAPTGQRPGSADHVPPRSAARPRQVNFSPAFVQRVADQLGLAWNPGAEDAADGHFTPFALFGYIYALFHAPSYRERFAASLRVGFPRVFVPARCELFRHLSELGTQLVTRHLLRTRLFFPAAFAGDSEADAAAAAGGPQYAGVQPASRVTLGRPRLDKGRVYLNDRVSIGPVPASVWQFHVGAHQVCHKWLKDRRGRTLDSQDLAHYRQILLAVQDTLTCMRQIDQTIAAHGGWMTAFV